jgi:hypothetical protein
MKQLEGLCPHGRHTTAVCIDCGLEAELMQNKQIDWKSLEELVGDVEPDEELPASQMQIGGDHYRAMVIQPNKFCHVNKLGALESNVVKYICRHHQKGGEQDLEKAMHYIALLMEWEYGIHVSIAKKKA